MKIKVLGKMWNLRFAKLKTKWGECDPDDIPNKEIRIASTAKGQIKLDTIIHEILHASNFKMLSEEYVEELSSDIARALWRLGYRCKEDGDE